MLLKIQTQFEISVPAGVKVISNDEWITLARKNKNGVVSIFTCLNSEINSYDLNDEKAWLTLRKAEIAAIAKL